MKFLRDNGLSLVLASLFLLFWSAQAVTGYQVHRQDALVHQRAPGSFGEYLKSGHFWQATGENWESEFLQMGFYVWLTTFLYQRGSAESLDPDKEEEHRERNQASKARASWFYRNSLSLAFLFLFFGSFAIHATGRLHELNEETDRTRRTAPKPRGLPFRFRVLVPILPKLAERIPRGAFDRRAEHLPAPARVAREQGGDRSQLQDGNVITLCRAAFPPTLQAVPLSSRAPSASPTAVAGTSFPRRTGIPSPGRKPPPSSERRSSTGLRRSSA